MVSVALDNLMDGLLHLEPMRDGVDIFADESPSLLCLELLLNQRRGVEIATAAALAIHYHFGKPFCDLNGTIASSTRWPYEGLPLRRAARALWQLLAAYLSAQPDPGAHRIDALPDGLVGALASLERYYNRSSHCFDPLRKVELHPGILRNISAERFHAISGLRFAPAILHRQLASAASILEIWKSGQEPERRTLRALDRVGDETADTLLVYLFKGRSLIVDEYLRRVLYRHFALEKPHASRQAVERVVGPLIDSPESARRLHARVIELGYLYCSSRDPHCSLCPLNSFPHRA